MKPLTREQVEALRSVPLGDLPNRLSIARRMAKAGQVVLAEAAGVSQSAISAAESGGAVRLPTAQRIAAALGAGVDDIFPPTGAVQ